MKKLILGILIGIALSASSLAVASEKIKMIMVPEYINNYKTLDLLNYLSQMKQKEDIKTKEEEKKEETPKPVENKNKKGWATIMTA